MRLNHESNFSKIAKLLAERALNELHGGSLFKAFNSYSFNFNSRLRKRRTGFCLFWTRSPKGKQFLWFFEIDLLQFHRIYLLFDWSILNFFRSTCMCLLRINLPNLCLNMNHFDAADFSECHSEEVMFLLTLSLCMYFFFIFFSLVPWVNTSLIFSLHSHPLQFLHAQNFW